MQHTRPAGRSTLSLGLGLGVLLYALPPIRWLLGHLVILFHEFGHAVVYWMFGYLAIPAFNFTHGGGVTTALNRFEGAVVLIPLGLAYWLYHRWRQGQPITAAAMIVGLYVALAWTPAHEILVAAAGHLATLVLAGVFLFRGRTGVASTGEVEQTLYIASGLYVYLDELTLAWRLFTSDTARMAYRVSPSGLTPDLVLIARSLGLRLEGTSFLYLLLCLLVPLALFWALRSHRTTIEPEAVAPRSDVRNGRGSDR